MAAVPAEPTVPAVQTVNITINGIPLAVPKGEMIVESAKRLGVDIPIFCYHTRLKPVGMCRMCLIEMGSKGPDGSVRMMPKPQTACSLPATEGLIVVTDSEKIHGDRRGVLEFLLVNHPLDCPICDRGGECPLQNNTLFYGPSTSRFIEVKRHAPKAFPLSKYVTLDLERCIQCGRCVRFTEEISGDAQLAFRFRGAGMQPSTFQMENFSSKFSGNVIEICPVGALTNSDYRFRARPWDLQTRPAICTNCGVGCNIFFDYRGHEMVRINGRTNEAINEEWTCDKGKFGQEFYNSPKRLDKVLVRAGSRLERSTWAAAFSLIRDSFGAGGASVAAIGGARGSNEDIFLMRRLFVDVLGSGNVDYRVSRFLPSGKDSIDQKFGRGFNPSSIASIEKRKTILVFGADLSDDVPIVFLRVRKGWFLNGARVIVAHSAETDADSFADTILRYRPGTGQVLAAGLAAIAGVKGSDQRLSIDLVVVETGVDKKSLLAAAELLKESSPAVITTHSLYGGDSSVETEEALAGLAYGLGGTFDNFGLAANSTGAALIGFQPGDGGLNTREILQGCLDGSIRSLWLFGCDLFAEFPDRDLVRRALEAAEFLVVQDYVESEATGYASLVLPMAAPAEMDGTYTNIEGRVQRMKQVIALRGDGKPAWKTAAELIARLRPESALALFGAGDVMGQIARAVPEFAGCSYEAIGAEGLVLGGG